MQLSDFSNQGYQNFEQVPLLELLFFDFYSEVSIPAQSGPFSHNGLIPAPPQPYKHKAGEGDRE